MTGYSILKPGYNCWRVAPARRVAFLVDGDAYFRAFRAAAWRARERLLMLGWDIDSRVRLLREAPADDTPNTLCEFLNAIVSRPRGPNAYVLTWDFAMLYALDREWLPIYKLDWRTHRRLHFRMDGRHPPGGSHHQKVVVVDDRVAFVGGLDLTRARWDTPEHRPEDPRRVDAADTPPYRPFHDLQMLVEGDIAAVLAELVCDRWQRATGERLDPIRGAAGNAWPPEVAPDIEDMMVAVARTDLAFDGRPEVREVELLYRDAIRAARKHIYIENQFFTAPVIADALADRLREPDGPEVIMVTGLHTDGWLSQHTMDVIRGRMVQRLRDADRYGRLRVYYPDIPGLRDQCLNVHSKVMIVDDEFVRVGSANLNNRSMGIDTECDLAFESGGEARIQPCIARLRARLLAEHLGTTPEAVAEQAARHARLGVAIDALRRDGRTLKPLPLPPPEEIASWLPDPQLLDPERPIDPAKLTDELVPLEERAPAERRILVAAGTLLLLLGLAAAWRWTSLGELLDIDTLTRQIAAFRDLPAAPVLALGAFVLGGLLVIPVTLLVVASALAFGPLLGFVYSLVGAVASAVVLYGLGRWLGRDAVRRFAGSRLNRLSRRLAQRGILTMIFVRVVPVAPFSVVNLVAGASHIGFRDYVLGTVLGMSPGIALIAVFIDRIGATVREPGPGAVLLLGGVVLLIALATYGLRRWAARHGKSDAAASGA